MAKKAKRKIGAGDVASNRRASHKYEFVEKFECGIELLGSEVKSLRSGKAVLADAYAVVNDGEVTALTGSMSLGENAILGIALGTSTAAGYVTADGNITSWLDELAFVPIDYNPAAPVDEWSGDYGVGSQYFSQQAVGRLLAPAGIRIENATVQDYDHHHGDAPSWVLADLLRDARPPLGDAPTPDLTARVEAACFYRSGVLSLTDGATATFDAKRDRLLITTTAGEKDVPHSGQVWACELKTGVVGKLNPAGRESLAVARFAQERTLREELKTAHGRLAERKVIERAKGLLMKQKGVPEEEAFRLMRKIAMDRNRKLLEVAQQIIDVSDLMS